MICYVLLGFVNQAFGSELHEDMHIFILAILVTGGCLFYFFGLKIGSRNLIELGHLLVFRILPLSFACGRGATVA